MSKPLDLIEVMARAICMADDSHDMGLWREFLPEARAALAALEKEGYVVTRKPEIPAFLAKPGIPHSQQPYTPEPREED